MSDLCEIDETGDGYALEWDVGNIFAMAGVRPQDAKIIGDGREVLRVSAIYPMRCSCSVSVGDGRDFHQVELYFSDIKVIHAPSGDVARHITKNRGGK